MIVQRRTPHRPGWEVVEVKTGLCDILAVAWHLARLTVGWCLLVGAERLGLWKPRQATEGEREYWRFRTRRLKRRG